MVRGRCDYRSKARETDIAGFEDRRGHELRNVGAAGGGGEGSRSWKRQRNRFPIEPPEECKPADNFSPGKHTSENKSVLF